MTKALPRARFEECRIELGMSKEVEPPAFEGACGETGLKDSRFGQMRSTDLCVTRV